MLKTTRRSMLATLPIAAGSALISPVATAQSDLRLSGFKLALNTGTIRGYKLPLEEQIELAIKTGYQGIEPWLSDLANADKTPGKLDTLRQRCQDANLRVVSAIGFAQWAVNDNTARANALEQMKRDMELVKKIGGTHIAAAPAGVNQQGYTLELDHAAERYHAILEIGRNQGVIPQIEFWGASANLSRLDECLYIAARAGHPDACILADAYHMYRGKSTMESISLLSSQAMHCFHINDYPSSPPRAELNDGHRIWPGDGIAPLIPMLRTMRKNNTTPWLSLELFNKSYWEQPAAITAATGLQKLAAVTAAASQ